MKSILLLTTALGLSLCSCSTPQTEPEAQYPPATYPAQPQAAQALPPGQWVYTYQYGWAWIPFDAQYTYYPVEAEAYPSQFVFVYGGGWRWVTAPWVWGQGPLPWWGPHGPWGYHWYHGWTYSGPGPAPGRSIHRR